MSRLSHFVISLALVLSGAAAFAGSSGSDCAHSNVQKDNVTGQILIRFEDSMSEVDAASIIQRIGAEEIDRMMDGRIYLIEIPYPSSQSDIIKALSATPGVVYAEPNQEVRIPEPPEGTEDGGGQGELVPLPKVD